MGQCASSKLRFLGRKSKRTRNGRDTHRAAHGVAVDNAMREEHHSKSRALIEKFVNDMIRKSTALFSSDPNAEPPISLQQLRRMSSENDEALIDIQLALVRCIPLDVSVWPFGTNLLVLVLDECSLFSRELLTRLIRELRLSSFLNESSGSQRDSHTAIVCRRTQMRRNICVLIGTLAEKMAGPNSAVLCTDEVLSFLFDSIAEVSKVLGSTYRDASTSQNAQADSETANCKVEHQYSSGAIDVVALQKTSRQNCTSSDRKCNKKNNVKQLSKEIESTDNSHYCLDSSKLNVILHSLIALEKLAHANASSKATILRRIYERNALVELTALISVVRNELARFHHHSPSVLSYDALTSFNKSATSTDLKCDNWLPISRLSLSERNWLSDLRQVAFECEWLLDNIFVHDGNWSTNTFVYGQLPQFPPSRNGRSASSHKQSAIVHAEVQVEPTRSSLKGPRALPTSAMRRAFRYELVDYSRLHVRMRNNDVSEYAKLDPLGFEVRSDHNGFETVRATLSVRRLTNVQPNSTGRRLCNAYYFEVVLLTNGIMQIGWSTPFSEFHSREGYGVGDDRYSIAFDGCRQLIWFEAKASSCRLPPAFESSCTSHSSQQGALNFPHIAATCAAQGPDAAVQSSRIAGGDSEVGWKAGDVLGSLLDLDGSFVAFYVNGSEVTRTNCLFAHTNRDTDEYFAAASLMSFQQAMFNLGQFPFLFSPGSNAFRSCYDAAREQYESLNGEKERASALEQRIVMPRPLFVKARLNQQLDATRPAGGVESPKCAICFETLRMDTKCRLSPCGHAEICVTCAFQCEQCPFCRSPIEERVASQIS